MTDCSECVNRWFRKTAALLGRCFLICKFVFAPIGDNFSVISALSLGQHHVQIDYYRHKSLLYRQLLLLLQIGGFFHQMGEAGAGHGQADPHE